LAVYINFIAACQAHCIIHLHWKLCRWPMVTTVPVQHHGMQLHTLLGVQAGVILHCIHMHSWSILLKWSIHIVMKLYHLAMFLNGSLIFLYHVKWKLRVKLMFNSTCGLNSQPKQVCLLRCFISPLLYSIQVLDACLEGKGISCTSHTPLEPSCLIHNNLVMFLRHNWEEMFKVWMLNLFMLEHLIFVLGFR
jgi:hypothetical protein